MSFDLYFCWQTKEPISFDAVAEWAKKSSHFQRQNHRLWYNNEDTGVYFSLDFEIKDPEEPVIPADYPDYFDSGLSFNLNYNRPSFFGDEAMPIVVDLYLSFGLTVYDPQTFDESALSPNPGVEGLTSSWLRSNRDGIAALKGQGVSSPRMTLSSSTYLWNYCRRKRDLQAQLGDEDVFVPTLFPFRKAADLEVGTAIVYTSGILMIVPETDWIIINRPRNPPLGPGKETEMGVVHRKTFDEAVGAYLAQFPGWESALRIIDPESIPQAENGLKSIDHMLPLNEFERVAQDGFIDVEDEARNVSASTSVH
jgi:hypothetical protein